MEKEKKEKKGNVWLITILIILLMVTFTGFGYALGGVKTSENVIKNVQENKDENKTVEKQDVDCSDITIYETTDEKVRNLIPNLLVGTWGAGRYANESHEIEQFANDKKVTVNDVSSERANWIVQRKLWSSEKESVTLEEVNSILSKYFGKGYSFNPETVNYNCMPYYYDAASKTFIKRDANCGGTAGSALTAYQVVKAIGKNDMMELTVKVVFSDTSSYYADYQHNVFVEKVNPFLPAPIEKGSKYLFTFKLEDGNYVFVSSEPIV